MQRSSTIYNRLNPTIYNNKKKNTSHPSWFNIKKQSMYFMT